MQESIIKVIADVLDIDSTTLKTNMKFEDYGMDSIIFIRLAVECENQFEIVFEDEKLTISEFATIDSFIEYVDYLCAEKISS